MLVTKQLLAPGTYWSWDEDRSEAVPVTYTRRDLREFYRQGKAMLQAGLPIPVPLAHDPKAVPMTPEELAAAKVKNNTGWVKDFSLDADGSVYTLLDIQDEDVVRKLPTTIKYVSPQIHPQFTDGAGRTWRNVVTHVALTTQPVWAGQKPFGSDGVTLMSLEQQGRHVETLFRDYRGGPLRLSLHDVIRFAWQANKSRRGGVKAVGTGEHAGKQLYGKRAEAALRGRKKAAPKVAKPTPQRQLTKTAPERPSRAGGPAEDARMAPPVVKPAPKPRPTAKQKTAQAAVQPDAQAAQARLVETLQTQVPEQELSAADRKAVNKALGQLKRHHGEHAQHRIRNLAEADLMHLANGRGDAAKLKARLQGYREMLRQLNGTAAPTPRPQPQEVMAKAAPETKSPRPLIGDRPLKADRPSRPGLGVAQTVDVLRDLKGQPDAEQRLTQLVGGLSTADAIAVARQLGHTTRSKADALKALRSEVASGSQPRRLSHRLNGQTLRGAHMPKEPPYDPEADADDDGVSREGTPEEAEADEADLGEPDDAEASDIYDDLEEMDEGGEQDEPDDGQVSQELARASDGLAKIGVMVPPSRGSGTALRALFDFVCHLNTALDTHHATKDGPENFNGDGNDTHDPTNPQGGMTMAGATEEPQVVSLSLQQRLERAEKRQADTDKLLAAERAKSRDAEIDGLVKTGRVAPARAKQWREDLGAKRLSLVTNDGALSGTLAQIEAAHDVPEGTFWSDEERTKRAADVQEEQPVDWDGTNGGKPDPDVMRKLTGGRWKPKKEAS